MNLIISTWQNYLPNTVTFTFFLFKASFSSSVTSTSSSNSSKKSSHVFLLPIFFNALLIKVFSTFAVFDSTNTPCGVHRCYCFSIWICFDEVVRNSRSIPNSNWTNNFLSFPQRNGKNFPNNFFFSFAEVNKSLPSRADFIGSVRKWKTNNILILAKWIET
jgi:hypothetical protein